MNTFTLPSKSNLMKIRNKIRLSKQGQNLLEKKKIILTMERNKVKDQCNKLASELTELISNGKKRIENAIVDIGINQLSTIAKETNINNNVDIKYKTIMGVEIPSIVETKMIKNYGLYRSPQSVDEAMVIFNEIKEKIIKYTELENTLYRLELNITKVQTRSNALKNIIIPNDERTEKNIADNLEERDREEFSKLKIIKNSYL